MKYVIFLFINCLPYFAAAQSLVDSTHTRHHNKRSSFINQVYILTLSESKTKSRFKIDDEHHDVFIECANTRLNFTQHLDSVCDNEHYPPNCSHDDSIQTNYPNKEKLDWGKSTRIFDFTLKNQQIDRKDLLKKWFGNLDSIVACREVFINDDTKPDLAIVRMVQGEEVQLDTSTHNAHVVPTGKIEFEIQILIDRDTCYSIIAKDDFTQLKYLYLANFKVIDDRFLYFFIDEGRRGDDGVERLWISEHRAD